MSSPPMNNQSQPVVQTILESFTRCFNPLEPCTKVCSSSSKLDGGSGANSKSAAGRRSNTSSPTLFGNIIGGNKGNKKSSASSLAARTVSRSSSSSESRRKKLQLDVSYDADGVSRAKKIHHRISSEALEERSMKRKLEIFRGSEGAASAPPKPLAPRHHSQSGRKSPPCPQSSAGQSPHIREAGPKDQHLALSDEEEELIRLQTQSKKRFACGMNMNMDNYRFHGNNSPISSVAKLFNFGMIEAQKPFGLCFATPVRTSSQENIANLSDDKLTDEEFLQRHQAMGGNGSLVSPDGDAHTDQSSYCEDETINSTLYFESKYSHVVQTRPPMPLFQEDMVSCGESKTDELSKLIKRRSAVKQQQQQQAQKQKSNNNNYHKNVPPMEHVTSKNQQRKRGSIFTSNNKQEQPPSPVRIRDESLSINTNSAESMNEEFDRMVHKLRQPSPDNMTAAEF